VTPMRAKISSWTVSIAAHLIAVGLLFFGLPYFQKPILAEEKSQGIEVLLLATAPPVDATPQPMVQPPPPPPPPLEKEPDVITSNSTEPDLEPVPPPKPKPVVTRPPKPQPPKQEPPKPVVEAPPATPAEQTAPQVAAAPVAPPAPAISAPRLPSNPDAEANYYAILLATLEKHKEYPRRAQLRRMEGVAHLRFTIDDQGRVTRHKIERSSGYDALDEAVERMIAKASPLPPIPANLNKSTLDVVVPIQFFLK
jgi:protein TonB